MSSENMPGMTEDRINSVVEYINNHIRDNIEKSIRICSDGFFNRNQYVPVQTVFVLPDGTEETRTIGTLFAFSPDVDVNTRIWWERVSLYVRFNEKYLYKDAYPLYPSTIYRMNIIDDLHKIFRREAKERRINECENCIVSLKGKIKGMKKEIEKMRIKIGDTEVKKEEISKWRCQ